MEQFKFDFFKKEHSSQTMNVVTLSKAECDKVFASFCSAYNMEKQERNQVFDIIQDKGIPVNFTNAEEKNWLTRQSPWRSNQTPTIPDRKRTECPLPHAVGF